MKRYFLFDSLIEADKTTPFTQATQTLFRMLELDVPSLKEAKSDVGFEMMMLDQEKFYIRNAFTLSKAAKENAHIVCPEQSSFSSLDITKEALQTNPELYEKVASALLDKSVTLNLDVEILSLEHFLLEVCGIEKLQTMLKRPFTKFQAALFQSSAYCRARKFNRDEDLNALLDLIELKRVKHEHRFESDGYELFDANSKAAQKLCGKAMLDMFDNAADFIVVTDARSFVMCDVYQKESEKLLGREIGLFSLTLPELLVLALGETNAKAIGVDKHNVRVTLL